MINIVRPILGTMLYTKGLTEICMIHKVKVINETVDMKELS